MAIPIIEGRVATEADVESGNAVFCVQDGRSAPYSFGRSLPIAAEIVNPNLGDDFPLGRQVLIVQAEITDGEHVTLGVLDKDELNVCALDDVKLLE